MRSAGCLVGRYGIEGGSTSSWMRMAASAASCSAARASHRRVPSGNPAAGREQKAADEVGQRDGQRPWRGCRRYGRARRRSPRRFQRRGCGNRRSRTRCVSVRDSPAPAPGSWPWPWIDDPLGLPQSPDQGVPSGGFDSGATGSPSKRNWPRWRRLWMRRIRRAWKETAKASLPKR